VIGSVGVRRQVEFPGKRQPQQMRYKKPLAQPPPETAAWRSPVAE